MRFKFLTAAAAICSPLGVAHAAPSDVNAQAFYADAMAVQKKGMAALFDKRTKPMMAQMKDAGARARADNIAAKTAGKPLYCPPTDKKGLGPQEVIAMIGRVPESERRALTLHQAWKRALAREYPCR